LQAAQQSKQEKHSPASVVVASSPARQDKLSQTHRLFVIPLQHSSSVHSSPDWIWDFSDKHLLPTDTDNPPAAPPLPTTLLLRQAKRLNVLGTSVTMTGTLLHYGAGAKTRHLSRCDSQHWMVQAHTILLGVWYMLDTEQRCCCSRNQAI
jgi:hypothetical protein